MTTTHWRDDAACSEADPAIFTDPDEETVALGYCHRCPVVEACLTGALRSDVLGGPDIWTVRGGTTGAQRFRMLYGKNPPKSKRNVRTRKAAICGTEAGYQRHRRQQGIACEDCREAHNALARQKKAAIVARRVEDVEWLLTHEPHLTYRAVATRLGIVAESLRRDLKWAGRDDLRDRMARNGEVAA